MTSTTADHFNLGPQWSADHSIAALTILPIQSFKFSHARKFESVRTLRTTADQARVSAGFRKTGTADHCGPLRTTRRIYSKNVAIRNFASKTYMEEPL